MNVAKAHTTVMIMQTARTLQAVSIARVILVTRETGPAVKVSCAATHHSTVPLYCIVCA
jgi:hypothetical protein